MSTASVYPEPMAAGFSIAAELGYDGVELMVWNEPGSQQLRSVARHSERTGMPVLAVHAPCLAITQRVWGADPAERLRRSVVLAAGLGAPTVVLHPPFRWQRRYAAGLARQVDELERAHGVRVAMENMFPLRRGLVRVSSYTPGHDPTLPGARNYTLDLSHTATAGDDAFELLERMGDRLVHLHLADGLGSERDEHLVPGRGTQPCADVLRRLALTGFDGTVVVEISTRRARSRNERLDALAESLLFARLHLGSRVPRSRT
ncbi:sugar phosphate isomerase/epimerase family protein [Actinomycetospora atypica]|uniref:Sugar phosphate isomerase/epimerase family protein n=1 Tax=Actinomycetospora atypica TaxID=1290095 RepID=A0ABV9YUD1_9PSEU